MAAYFKIKELFFGLTPKLITLYSNIIYGIGKGYLSNRDQYLMNYKFNDYLPTSNNFSYNNPHNMAFNPYYSQKNSENFFLISLILIP